MKKKQKNKPQDGKQGHWCKKEVTKQNSRLLKYTEKDLKLIKVIDTDVLQGITHSEIIVGRRGKWKQKDWLVF